MRSMTIAVKYEAIGDVSHWEIEADSEEEAKERIYTMIKENPKLIHIIVWENATG